MFFQSQFGTNHSSFGSSQSSFGSRASSFGQPNSPMGLGMQIAPMTFSTQPPMSGPGQRPTAQTTNSTIQACIQQSHFPAGPITPTSLASPGANMGLAPTHSRADVSGLAQLNSFSKDLSHPQPGMASTRCCATGTCTNNPMPYMNTLSKPTDGKVLGVTQQFGSLRN